MGDITVGLKRLGLGAVLYKVDVNRAFRHVKVDPGDYDLLGLQWKGHYVLLSWDMFQKSDFSMPQHQQMPSGLMHQECFTMIDYNNDSVGVGVPSFVYTSYVTLLDLMSDLALTVSQKKLVAPSTQVMYLGLMIDTLKDTIAISPEKLDHINSSVQK